MQCDLHAALAEDALLDQLSWRKQGMLIALDIARGLSCESHGPLPPASSLHQLSWRKQGHEHAHCPGHCQRPVL